MRRTVLPLLMLMLMLLLAAPARAQTMRDEVAALAGAKRQQAIAVERAARLEAQAGAARDAAAKARADRATMAARIQAAEADIATAQARITLIEQLRARQRARLAARQAPIVRLTTALVTMARRPPALALVQPGSVSDVVHVRSVLAATLPVIRARTEGLRAEVAAGNRLRADADTAVALLRQGQQALEARRRDLVRLEAAERARSARLVDSAMFEAERAQAMGEEARDIVELMGEIEQQTAAGARLAELPGPIPRPAAPTAAAAPIADRIAAAPRLPPYRLPVMGRVVAGLGEVSATGIRARGLTLAAARGAQVVAPTAGRIVFAGPFRGYGRIVIVDHGHGWTTLLTRFDALGVKVGDVVQQGSPLGTAAGGRAGMTVELRRDGRPIDITPLIGIG